MDQYTLYVEGQTKESSKIAEPEIFRSARKKQKL